MASYPVGRAGSCLKVWSGVFGVGCMSLPDASLLVCGQLAVGSGLVVGGLLVFELGLLITVDWSL